jgi:hypothetical protein
MPPTDEDIHIYSLFAKKLEIPSIKANPARWNKGWEKALHTLSSNDVYATISKPWGTLDASQISEMSQLYNDEVCRIQGLAAEAWRDIEQKGHFDSAWLLLDEGERRRHLMNGLTKTCMDEKWFQDVRAMCPDITISSMLKQKGRAFIDFIRITPMQSRARTKVLRIYTRVSGGIWQ